MKTLSSKPHLSTLKRSDGGQASALSQHKLRLVFFGSSKYSTIIQEKLFKKFGLILCVTLPDKPVGRNKKLTPNPVKKFAIDNQVSFLTFETLDNLAVKEISKRKPGFIIVADYGKILPETILQIPKYAALNVHHSLLPKYRGPSPAPSVILNGEKKSGVTIIEMEMKVDAGDILAQKEYVLSKDETTDSLLTCLNQLGAEILIDVIGNFIKGSVKRIKQNQSMTTYTHRFKKEDGYIDLDSPPKAVKLDRMVRAFYPWPGVWTQLPSSGRTDKTQNSPLRQGFEGQTKLKTIKFLPNNLKTKQPRNPFLIQPEGKRPMTTKEFLNGYPQLKEKIEKLMANG